MRWIGVLCIDQSDVPEKNAQVGQTMQIYERAQRVPVWLGKEENTSAAAADFIAHFDELDNHEAIFQRTHAPECLSTIHAL